MTDLRELIADRIRSSGPISFAEFMELSLYHPELGYYARAAQKTGRAGDFFTSVDVGPIFGELLARQFGEMWRLQQGGFDLVEAGAGSGRLARDILDAARSSDAEFYSAIRLHLVEASPAARAAQAATLGPHASLLATSGASLPERIRGVLFANELLDALPTHCLVMTDNGLREIFVDLDGSTSAVRFVEKPGELSTPRLAEYLSRAGAVMYPGWRAEVNLAAEDWVKSAALSLLQGFLVIVDYGHDEAELYNGSHATGTITSFQKHSAPSNVLDDPGEADITAHVDLTAITRAASGAGLEVVARLDQTYFVLGLAELDALPLHKRLALKTLLLPGGLGSTHKVLIFGKGVGTPPLKGCSYKVRLT